MRMLRFRIGNDDFGKPQFLYVSTDALNEHGDMAIGLQDRSTKRHYLTNSSVQFELVDMDTVSENLQSFQAGLPAGSAGYKAPNAE